MAQRRLKKILIVNTFGIGDVLFTFPLMASIRASLPDVKIHYVSNRRTVELLEHHPDVDQVVVYNRDLYKRLGRRSFLAFLRELWRGFRRVQCERYDAVIDLTLNMPTSVFMALAGIPKRIGYDFRGRGFFLTHRKRLAGFDDKPVAEYYLDLLPFLGVPVVSRELSVQPTPQERAAARALVEGVPRKPSCPWVAMVPGGGASWGTDADAKRWPVEHFVEVARKLMEERGAEVILLGSPGEAALCQQMQAALPRPAHILCGQTSLREVAAVFELCDLAIMNDGGLLHLAAAVGTRTVAIFGPVDQRVYGAFSADPAKHRTVVQPVLKCRPCYRRFRRASCQHFSCLRRLTADEVWRAVDSFDEALCHPHVNPTAA